jgi:hypothetical protein
MKTHVYYKKSIHSLFSFLVSLITCKKTTFMKQIVHSSRKQFTASTWLVTKINFPYSSKVANTAKFNVNKSS